MTLLCARTSCVRKMIEEEESLALGVTVSLLPLFAVKSSKGIAVLMGVGPVVAAAAGADVDDVG